MSRHDSTRGLQDVKKIYNQFKGKKKILGICLGFQQILHAEGGKIVQQKKIYHGYKSIVNVLPISQLFKTVKHFSAGRYPCHFLVTA